MFFLYGKKKQKNQSLFSNSTYIDFCNLWCRMKSKRKEARKSDEKFCEYANVFYVFFGNNNAVVLQFGKVKR